jgi:transposase
MCQRGDRLVGYVARNFDLTQTAVHEWSSRPNGPRERRSGLTSTERQERQSW